MTTFKSTPLFGGAITVDLPSTFSDVSNIRQVPDHQEVYLDSNGFTSVMFDILERVDEATAPNDEEALKYHFNDIVSGTGDHTELYVPGDAPLAKLPTTRALTLLATQHPTAKRASTDADFTVIQLILIRLASQETDIVISVNVPHVPGEDRDEDVEMLVETAKWMRDQILGSFEVRNWGLFGE
ncbi:hypothetical protein H2201_007212 [Coniosporium apollinis]|uniref:Mog1p/PsbP-like protein n=2 Tax=Coniosporium TaxID=2810619 RepID=A0ABQ9NN87_9PEZI|nr:hypothetical protein H2199_002030 [Cladosporium sp. JES 115]KAJ9659776.1 hypothetical protein H2201_007212 [Coniosporium apollinis]